MKIIDKTPLVDEKGGLGFSQRIQGMLKYGFRWPRELQAQQVIINFFDRQLERGYTLIRNMTLGQSGIMIPMILLGPAGIFAINITHLRGQYEAKGASWNVASGDGYKPAPVNLVQETARMARALQTFIERQGTTLPLGVEPVLIAADPGLHIDSVGPNIKVMMIDGIKPFVSGLSGARVLSQEAVFEFSERILNPRAPRREPVTARSQAPRPAWEGSEPSAPDPEPEVSRARAIFDAAENPKPFNPADFDFGIIEDDPESAEALSALQEMSASNGQPAAARRRVMGMTPPQLVVIVGLGLALVCILAVFVILVLNTP